MDRFFKRDRYTRGEIVEKMRENVSRGKPVIGAGCSTGIVAKCAAAGGADCIIAYSTGLSRVKGFPTTPYGPMDSNFTTIEMAEELSRALSMIDSFTPLIGGLDASDPHILDLEEAIKAYQDAGFHGIINFPTIMMYEGRWSNMREGTDLGWSREIELMQVAHDMDVFTMAYVWSPEYARDMAEIPVDVMCPHAGGTSGGKVGFKASGKEEAAKAVQKMIEVTKEVNEDILCLGHGGPFAEPEDTEYLYEHTNADGFVGASSIERIPVEKAIEETLKKYKGILLKK